MILRYLNIFLHLNVYFSKRTRENRNELRKFMRQVTLREPWAYSWSEHPGQYGNVRFTIYWNYLNGILLNLENDSFSPHYLADKRFKGTVVNRELPSLHGRSLEITLTVQFQNIRAKCVYILPIHMYFK